MLSTGSIIAANTVLHNQMHKVLSTMAAKGPKARAERPEG